MAPESQAMDGKSSTLSVGLAGPTRTFWTRGPWASRSCWARAEIQWLRATGCTHAAGHEAAVGSEQRAMARTAALRGAAAV